MRVLVLSIHPMGDNRIMKQIGTLEKKGIAVEYINISKRDYYLARNKQNNRFHNLNIDFSKKNILLIPLCYLFIVIYIKNRNFDVIHVHDPLLLPITIFIDKAKIVYDRHESFEKVKGINPRISSLFENYFSKYLDGIVYVNNEQFEYVKNLKIKFCCMVPNYPLKSSFTYTQVKDNNGIGLIYAGMLSEESRNILMMLDIIDKVLGSSKDAYCIIAGPCDDKRVLSRISNLKRKHVRFSYLGNIPYSEVVEKYKTSDIGLYFVKDTPNNKNSSPNKIYEYLMSGLAIIAMAKLLNCDEINNKAGKIFPYSEDIDSISSYIVELINSRAKLNEYKNNAKLLGEKYIWENVEGNYLKLYNQICGRFV